MCAGPLLHKYMIQTHCVFFYYLPQISESLECAAKDVAPEDSARGSEGSPESTDRWTHGVASDWVAEHTKNELGHAERTHNSQAARLPALG